VFHLILGLNDDKDVGVIFDWCKARKIHPKILFLGYKHYGNGKEFYNKNVWLESKLTAWRSSIIRKVMKNFGTFSFDNLAIDQLQLQTILSKEEWDLFYLGNDGNHSAYADAVKQEFARQSTSDVRYKICRGETMKSLFDKVKTNQ
jgi:hypothetical protein